MAQRSADALPGRLDEPRLGWLVRPGSNTANAVIIAALARLITGQPVSERRIRVGGLAYAIFFAAVYSVCGFIVGDAIGAARIGDRRSLFACTEQPRSAAYPDPNG